MRSNVRSEVLDIVHEVIHAGSFIDADELGDEKIEMPKFLDDISTTDSQLEPLGTGAAGDNDCDYECERTNN